MTDSSPERKHEYPGPIAHRNAVGLTLTGDPRRCCICGAELPTGTNVVIVNPTSDASVTTCDAFRCYGSLVS